MKTKSTSQPVRRSFREGGSAPARPPAREEFRSSPWLAVVFSRRRLSGGGPCRAVAFSEGGFFNLRALIVLAVLFAGVFLALFAAAMRPPGPVTQAWVARYDGPGNSSDIGISIAVDSSGNVYVTGVSLDPVTAGDYATVKYNSTGEEQWAARYNGPGNGDDAAVAVAVDGSGNVYVTGRSMGSGTGLDYATIKYDSSGQEQWIARYNGPGNAEDRAWGIAVDGSGNVYVTGASVGSGTSHDYATIKYDATGQQQWIARYNNNLGDDDAFAIAVDSSGNVYVTGHSSGGLGTALDYATIKYDATGQQQWVARYDGPAHYIDLATAIAVDSSGNVYVTGTSIGLGTSEDYATIKYSPIGQEQWVARYNGPGNGADEVLAPGVTIAVDGSGNVHVTGTSVGLGTGEDYATIKYDATGQQQWVARYNGPGNNVDEARGVALDSLGNVYVTGGSVGSRRGSPNSYDYATIKYDASGQEEWITRGPSRRFDYAQAIAVDSSANVYVTGGSSGAGSEDYATIKYVQNPP